MHDKVRGLLKYDELYYSLWAYFHCQTRIWIRTRIPVVYSILPLVRTLIPWLKCMQQGWGSVPKMGTVTIWERDLNLSPHSGNIFCIILCSHRYWNPSPSPNLNPSPAVEISHYNVHPVTISRLGLHRNHWQQRLKACLFTSRITTFHIVSMINILVGMRIDARPILPVKGFIIIDRVVWCAYIARLPIPMKSTKATLGPILMVILITTLIQSYNGNQLKKHIIGTNISVKLGAGPI